MRLRLADHLGRELIGDGLLHETRLRNPLVARATSSATHEKLSQSAAATGNRIANNGIQRLSGH